jgi:hypothetical protein
MNKTDYNRFLSNKIPIFYRFTPPISGNRPAVFRRTFFVTMAILDLTIFDLKWQDIFI